MKYKKICCILSAMLVIHPQYIRAENLSEQADERNNTMEAVWESEEASDKREETPSEFVLANQVNSGEESFNVNVREEQSGLEQNKEGKNGAENTGMGQIQEGEGKQEKSAGVEADKEHENEQNASAGVEQDKECESEQSESAGVEQDKECESEQSESTDVGQDSECESEQNKSADVEQDKEYEKGQSESKDMKSDEESPNGQEENKEVEGDKTDENVDKEDLDIEQIVNEGDKIDEGLEQSPNYSDDRVGHQKEEELSNNEADLSHKVEDYIENVGMHNPVNREEDGTELIDLQTKPRITVHNIQQFSAYSRTVIPEIIIESPTLDPAAVELILESRSKGILAQQVAVKEVDGRLCYSLPEIEDDDQYILRIKNHSSDKTYEQAVVFSVNRTGTVFQYDESKSEVTLSETFTPQIHLQNVDSTEVLSCMVNGRETAFDRQGDQLIVSEEFLKEGKNQIIVAVKDQAGNVSIMDPWEFMIRHSDRENSLDSVAGVEKKEGIWKYLFMLIETLLSQLGNGTPFKQL